MDVSRALWAPPRAVRCRDVCIDVSVYVSYIDVYLHIFPMGADPCFHFQGVPLTAPAFSWTAHTAQGQTLKAAIVDMQIGAGTSPMASYVAFTRVKRMEDLLIFRPFDRALFNQGNLEGPELLLKVLRGEHIDWQAVEEKHMPSHMCAACDTKQFKAEFSEEQWRQGCG